MKFTNFILTGALIFLFSGVAIAGDWKNESGKGGHVKPPFSHNDRDYRRGSDNHYRQGYNPDYQRYSGYRSRPYDRGRHYGHQEHKGHRYEYQGHWRSWEQWDGYARKHPYIYKYGHYYRENTHLMFRFRDPNTGGLFFFSIGR